jgi:choline-sulfatase
MATDHSSGASAGPGDTRPNLLIVVADQVNPFLTAPYGDPVARTPAMTEIAGEGVRFDAAYTPFPLCAPARASFLTGRHASAVGCLDNASILPADEPTFGHHLSRAGYETVLTGKMHFVGPDQLHGFGRRLTTDVFPAGVGWVPAVDEEGRFPAGGHARHYVDPDPGVRTWTQFMAFDEETQFRALEYLRERGRTGARTPFCLVVSYHHPHDPFHVLQEDWDRYDGVEIPIPDVPGDIADTYTAMDRWANEAHGTDRYDVTDPASLRHLRRAYYAALSYVDAKLGELLTALERSGERERTAVLVTSDHGDMLGERGMVQKRCFYEPSARVPLLLSLPGGTHAGRVVTTPVSLVDVLPTLLDLAAVPETDRTPVDGISLLDVLEEDAVDRAVLSEYHLEKVRAPCFMVRKGRFKYMLVHGYDRRLFDLETDPAELHDLAPLPEYATVVAELHAIVLEAFDPDALAAEGAASVRRRVVVKEAMERTGTRWDYTPVFDGTTAYVR